MQLQGRMSPMGLTTNLFISHAETYHMDTQVVSIDERGKKTRSTWGKVGKRSRHLASALKSLGVMEGDILGTISPNTINHLELLYAISGCGAVAHTINPRLFPDEIVFIINDAKDKILFVDTAYLPFLIGHKHLIPSVNHMYIIGPKKNEVAAKMNGFKFLEDLYKGSFPTFVWPEFDENTASGLCYTSGTTGNPKGVLYSHRSTVLHALIQCFYNVGSFSPKKKILPIVPLFHANAWGIPYSAPISGTSLVFPGANLDGKSVYDLLEKYSVNSAWGVPTVWMGLLEEISQRGGKKPDGLEEMLVGGSAAAKSLIEAFENMGVRVIHAWGMTETSPLGTSGRLISPFSELPVEEQRHLQTSQGRKIFMVDLKIVDDNGKRLPEDGKNIGNLYIRGNTIAGGYYNNEEASKAAIDDEGYFGTGDVASIDEQGFLRLTDRAKDLIKSGGEWISSIDLENRAMSHPDVENCAVIAIPHEKWDERPLLVVVPAEGKKPSKEELIKHLEGHFAKWQMPDDVVYEDELPLTATGKVSKLTLRQKYENYTLAS